MIPRSRSWVGSSAHRHHNKSAIVRGWGRGVEEETEREKMKITGEKTEVVFLSAFSIFRKSACNLAANHLN